MESRFHFNIRDISVSKKFNYDIDKSFVVNNLSTISNPQSNTIIFSIKKKWKEEYIKSLQNIKESLILLEEGLIIDDEAIKRANMIVFVSNPRLEFAQLVEYIISCEEQNRHFQFRDGNICVGENVAIGSNTIIEPFVLIGHNVRIGDDCIIKTGVKIRNDVTIGDHVVIGENSVIGGQGFGVEQDEKGQNYRIPHIGGVVIGNYVEIGALTSIVSGTIEPTVIEEYAFIDDLNHIAHNCRIGKSAMLTGMCEVSGSAELGEKCYLAPGSCIRNGVKIGDGSFIGQMTLVTKDIPEGSAIAGNPGEDVARMKIWRKIQKELIEDRISNSGD